MVLKNYELVPVFTLDNRTKKIMKLSKKIVKLCQISCSVYFCKNHILFRNAFGHCTKMKFSIKDYFSKCDQIRSFLRIWSHLLKKSLMENFGFCAVVTCIYRRLPVILPSDHFHKIY